MTVLLIHDMTTTGELHLQNALGSARAIVPHRDLIVECISIVKPSLIVSVPVLFNKVPTTSHGWMDG